MKLGFLPLKPRLSAISWTLIEGLILSSIALLPFSKSFAEAGLTVAICLWVLRKFPWDEPLPELPKIYAISYSVFLVACLFSATQAPADLQSYSLRAFLKWVQYIGIFWMCCDFFKDPAKQNRFLWAFVLGMVVVGLDGVYQAITGYDIFRGRPLDPGRFFRIKSVFNEPNGLATFLYTVIPMTFWIWIREKKWTPMGICAVTMLTVFSGVFAMTLSRGAFISFFVSILIYLLFRKNFLIVAVGVLMLLVFLFSSGVTQKNYISSLRLDEGMVQGRLKSLEYTIKMIQARPFLGNGCGLYYQRLSDWTPEVGHKDFAQNSYLRIWGEVGVFGFFAFLAPLGFFFLSVLRRLRSISFYGWTHALCVGLLAFLLQSFIDANFHAFQTSVLFWTLWPLLLRRSEGHLGWKTI